MKEGFDNGASPGEEFLDISLFQSSFKRRKDFKLGFFAHLVLILSEFPTFFTILCGNLNYSRKEWMGDSRAIFLQGSFLSQKIEEQKD
jgi:hypothetical protein